MPPVGSCSAAGKAAIGPLEFPDVAMPQRAGGLVLRRVHSVSNLDQQRGPSRRLGVQAKAHLSQFLLLETN
jgi:hypothetical protein